MTEASELIRAIAALAWPIAAVVIVLFFRPEIKTLLNARLKRLKAGPFLAEWDEQVAEVQTEVEQAGAPTPERVPTPLGPLSEALAERAAVDPSGAVLEAHARIEDRLRDLLMQAGVPAPVRRSTNASRLAEGLRRRNLITDEAARAVEGLSVMRNLVSHGGEGEVTPQRAREYLALADGVLFAIGQRPS